MYTKTVRLPYTLWYDGHDKIFRMDMSTILPEEHYEDGKKYVCKIRNVKVGGYNVDGDITDEFITNGQALDMVKNKAIESANLVANDSGLGLSLNWKSFGQLSWDNLKQYLGGSNSTEFTTTTLEDIIAMLNNASENIRDEITNNIVTGLQSHINVQENSSKDIDIYYNADFYTTQGRHINELRKLFTIPRSLLGGEGQPVDTESIKNSILSAIQQQIPNATTIKQEILADVNPRIPDKEVIKQEVLAAVPTSSYELTPGKMNAVINELDYATDTTAFIDNIHNHFAYDQNLKFIKSENSYIIEYKNYVIMTIPFSSLRELPTATAGESITIEKILELVSDESKSEVISQLKSKLASTPLTAEQILDQATEAAADREKAGKLFQKLLDAETLNVVEKTDGYELSYTGDVNKVLVKIPKQAITVSQEVITAALTENVVTETIKPTLDKSYYSKEEVDNLIKKLKEELTAEDHEGTHSEEHPQQ